MQLIRNAALRARITEHYADNANSHVMEVLGVVPKYREHVRGMTPWPIQRYIWAHCYRSGKKLAQQLIDCPYPISDDEAKALIQRYRQDASLTAKLRFWLATEHTAQFILGDLLSEAVQVSQGVQVELDRR